MRRRTAQVVILIAAVTGSAGVAWAAGGGLNTVGPSTRIQPTGRKLKPVGKLTQLGNFPTGGALTPNGRFLWTLSTGRGRNDIRIVRVSPGAKTGKIVQRIRMPGLSGGIAISHDGTRAYVSGLADSPHKDQRSRQHPGPGRGRDPRLQAERARRATRRRAGVIPVPPPPSAPTVQSSRRHAESPGPATWR